MADIAFLLLIFFMVTTTIVSDKGLALQLPPYHEMDQPIAKVNERNLFKILINSQDQLMVENETRDNYKGLHNEIKKFILNAQHNPNWSESPEKAVVSIKTGRGTTQEMYIHVLNEAKAAYYEIYAERTGLSPS